MHHHKWNIEHIDNLMPWEKEIYVNMLIAFLKEERRMKEQQAAGIKIQTYKFVNPEWQRVLIQQLLLLDHKH